MTAALAAMIAAQAIPAVIGGLQYLKGHKTEPERPTYEIPSSVYESLDMARQRMSQVESPYASLQRENIDKMVSGYLDAYSKGSTSGTDYLSGITNANRMQEAMVKDMAEKNITSKLGAEQNLMQQLANMSGWQNQAWNWNVGDKYKQAAAASSALKGAGMQNIVGGLQGLAGTFAQNEINKSMQELYSAQIAREKAMTDALLAKKGTELGGVYDWGKSVSFVPGVNNQQINGSDMFSVPSYIPDNNINSYIFQKYPWMSQNTMLNTIGG